MTERHCTHCEPQSTDEESERSLWLATFTQCITMAGVHGAGDAATAADTALRRYRAAFGGAK